MNVDVRSRFEDGYRQLVPLAPALLRQARAALSHVRRMRPIVRPARGRGPVPLPAGHDAHVAREAHDVNDVADDARLLAWLDRLLDAQDGERERLFEQVAREAPQSLARLRRLVDAALGGTRSALRAADFLPAAEPAPAHAGPELQAGDTLGPYRLERVLGQGGTSVVWLGERAESDFRHQVAIKLPLSSLASPVHRARFERERDLLARLQHPSIGRLFDAGVAPGGRPYIVMEHIEGTAITTYCETHALGVAARLEVFLQVLAAVEHAHRHLVIHRDIKPSNILVDATGTVKLLDFGIAKLLPAQAHVATRTQLTLDGGPMMTERYAAPEQLRNESTSTATDIYALGVLLYELLTGRWPYGGAHRSRAQDLMDVLHASPVSPSQADLTVHGPVGGARLRATLAGDLDTIVLKALRKAPADRYATAERFADDVRRYLDHRPLSARAPTFWHDTHLFLRRHRAASLAAGLGGAVALVLGVLLFDQHARTTGERLRADTVRDFMMDLVEDVQADESHAGAQVTGLQMLRSGMRRAHDRFAGQPQLLGELLGEFGRMFLRLDDDAQAAAAIQESMGLLATHAAPDDPALNKTRLLAAEMAFDRDDVRAAGALASTALAACTAAGAECAKARSYAHVMLANLALRHAGTDDALRHMREAVADAGLGFGPTDPDTALTWQRLAVIARNAGELQEAGQAIGRATAITRHADLRAQDREDIQRTGALIEFDLGRYAPARSAFATLLARPQDARESAVLWRMQANVELALGHAQAALAAASQALAGTGAPSAPVDVLFARQAHARALALSGSPAPAATEMQAVLAGLADAGFQPQTLEVRRARRLLAEVRVRQGALDDAERLLAQLESDTGDVRGGAAIELAQALDLHGCLARDRGDLAQAARLHERARALLAASLPADHPIVLRNAVYRTLAKALLHGPAAGDADFQRTARDYAARFGQASVWTTLVDAQLDPAACHARTGPSCSLVL
jgi:serine/threonine-protein kinase